MCFLGKRWGWMLSAAVAAAVWAILPAASNAQTTTSTTKPSFGDSISSGVAQTVDKFGQAVTPKPTPADDPVALAGKGKPGVELYVAVARMYEESGKLAEAENEYKRAFQIAPKDLRVLLGYARLKDHMDEPQEALKYYQKAVEAHSDTASVFNNLAVHYARRGMLRDAIGAMDHAVQLRPKEPRYRNNLATLLVEVDRPREAFNQLRAIYDDAVAHYNLGFLLTKRGDRDGAVREFATALRFNPSLTQARQWLDRLNASPVRGPLPPPIGPMGPELGQPLPARGVPQPSRDELRTASRPASPPIDYDARNYDASRSSGVRALPAPPAGSSQADDAGSNRYPSGAAVQALPPAYSSGPALQRLPPPEAPSPEPMGPSPAMRY